MTGYAVVIAVSLPVGFATSAITTCIIERRRVRRWTARREQLLAKYQKVSSQVNLADWRPSALPNRDHVIIVTPPECPGCRDAHLRALRERELQGH